MATTLFNIGLDFGTYQSKACVFHISSDPQKHEFIEFHDDKGNSSFFLPSRIELTNDDKFHYGFVSGNPFKELYTYFKIASAEDPHFKIVSEMPPDKNLYERNEFGKYSPEFLSCMYLTYMLLTIKQQLIRKHKNKVKTRVFGGVAEQETTEIKFTVQIGIPTEWSEEINVMRRRKFETILLVSEYLQQHVKNLDNFLQLNSNELKRLTQKCLIELQQASSSKERFEEILNERGLSVYPETAAGLTFLVNTKKLEPGYYLALDIGGGSTDVSFFKVESNNTFRYLASESLVIAANNVYKLYHGRTTPSLSDIRQSESEIKKQIQNSQWEKDLQYLQSIKKVTEQFHSCIYQIFNKRVYWFFERHSRKAMRTYENQPCFVYGGGSYLPNSFSTIKIHDDGQSTGNTETYVSKKSINAYVPKENILPSHGKWKDNFSLLVVAFGLSFVNPKGKYLWETKDYRTCPKPPKLVPHPFNEDLYIYDFLEEKWVKGMNFSKN